MSDNGGSLLKCITVNLAELQSAGIGIHIAHIAVYRRPTKPYEERSRRDTVFTQTNLKKCGCKANRKGKVPTSPVRIAVILSSDAKVFFLAPGWNPIQLLTRPEVKSNRFLIPRVNLAGDVS